MDGRIACWSVLFSVSAGAKYDFHVSAASWIHLPAGESVLPTMTLSASCKVSWAHPQDEGQRLLRGKTPLWGCPLCSRASGTSKVSCLSGQRQQSVSLYSPVGGIEPLQGALRAGSYVAVQRRYPPPGSLAMMTRLSTLMLPMALLSVLRKRGQKCLFLTPAPSFAFQEVPQSPVFGSCAQHQCDRKSSALARFRSITSASGSAALLCSVTDWEKE